jgi:amino acid transporter
MFNINQRNLPRAIMISMPLITLFYLVTNIAYMLVLTPSEIVSSDAVALTFSEKTLGSFAWLTPLFISFSTFGALSSCILSSSRIYYAAARDGNLPQCFALISLKNFTPVTCIVLQVHLCLIH